MKPDAWELRAVQDAAERYRTKLAEVRGIAEGKILVEEKRRGTGWGDNARAQTAERLHAAEEALRQLEIGREEHAQGRTTLAMVVNLANRVWRDLDLEADKMRDVLIGNHEEN
jgi:hypothetical protein